MREAHAILTLGIAGSTQQVAVMVGDIVHPREAREAIWFLRDVVRRLPEPLQGTLPLLAANAISLAGRSLLTENGIGYFDSGGSLSLSAPGFLIIVDRPPARRVKRMIGAIFEGHTARVLHAAFDRREHWSALRDLAGAAQVSGTTVSKALIELDRRGWLETQGRGAAKLRRLSLPGAMLDAWTDFLRERQRPSFKRYQVPIDDPARVMAGLHQACENRSIPYAATGEAAAFRHMPSAPGSRRVQCRLVAGKEASALVQALGAKPAGADWNLGVIEVDSAEYLFDAAPSNDIVLTTPLQTYLDLVSSAGTCELGRQIRLARLRL